MNQPCIVVPLLLVASVAVTQAAEPAETPAQAATRHYERARAALAIRDYATAASEFDAALDLYDDANLAWNAARAHHNAGHLALAQERYERCLRYPSLPAEQRALIPRYLSEIELALTAPDTAPEPPAPMPDSAPPEVRTGAWLLASGGLAVAATGLVLHFVAEGDRDRVIDARTSESPVVTSITQAQARRIEEDANTLDTSGAVLLATGGAALLGGVVWLLLPSSARTDVAIGLRPAGGGLSVRF